VATKPLNPKAQLAKAVRASLAAHHAQFRYRVTMTLIHPTPGLNPNPLMNVSGIADFDKNLVSMNDVAGIDAEQPFQPDVSVVVDGDSEFGGATTGLVGGGAWTKVKTPPGDAADVQVTQVLQDVTGPVRIVGRTKTAVQYQLQSNLSQLIHDQTGAPDDQMVRDLAGTRQTEDVWVDTDGHVIRARWTIDPGKAHVSGLDPSTVKALYVTIDFANYGVDLVVPPHPTAAQLAAG
jgi:hypothetical protein